MTNTADAIVLGMGPGGEEVSGRLAKAGLDVVAINDGLVGGECPNWGCVPSKMMIRASDLIAETRRAPQIAGASSIEPDWSIVARRIRDEATHDWDDSAAVESFESKGGRLVRGKGRITGPMTVDVDGTTYEARRALVIATGTAPSVPEIDGLADAGYWTNHEAIATTSVPGSLIVLGGGAIGCELAQVFSRFGSDVTIVEGEPHLVPSEEVEACELLQEVFTREGITLATAAKATSVSVRDGTKIVQLSTGAEVSGAEILVATGRTAHLSEFGVDAVGLDAGARYVDVDERMRAGDGIWAVGDVTGKGLFTHVAVYQGQIAAADILGEDHAPADYSALPRVTFTDPEVASVGMTEQQARDAGLDVGIGTSDVSKSARGWMHKGEGLIKLVVDKTRGVLVGATSAGPCGGEVLSMLTLAIHAKVPIAQLRTMIYAYPTFHRGVEDALRDLTS